MSNTFDDYIGAIMGRPHGRKWKLLSSVPHSELGYRVFTYYFCRDNGEPEVSNPRKEKWIVNLKQLREYTYKMPPRLDGISPVILKIREMETRYKERQTNAI